MKKTTTLLLFISFYSSLLAQTVKLVSGDELNIPRVSCDRIFCDGDGYLYFATEFGLFRYNGNKAMKYLNWMDSKNALYIDSIKDTLDGDLLISTNKDHLKYKYRLPKKSKNDYVNGVFIEIGKKSCEIKSKYNVPSQLDCEGITWEVNGKKLEAKKNRDSIQIIFGEEDYQPTVNDIYRESSGGIWFATEAGVYFRPCQESVFIINSFSEFPVLKGMNIADVDFIEKYQKLILTAKSSGVFEFDWNDKNKAVQNIEKPISDSTGKFLFSHVLSDGRLLYGGEGFLEIQGTNFKYSKKEDVFKYAAQWLNDTIIISSRSNKLFYLFKKGTSYDLDSIRIDSIGESYYLLTDTTNKYVYLTTLAEEEDFGLVRLDINLGLKKNKIYYPPNSLFKGKRVTFIHKKSIGQETEFWVGTHQDGIVILDNFLRCKRVIRREDGLPDNSVYGIGQVGDRMFAYCHTGLAVIDYQHKDTSFYMFNKYSGMPHNESNGCALASDGSIIWSGTVAGPMQVNGKQQLYPATNWKSFLNIQYAPFEYTIDKVINSLLGKDIRRDNISSIDMDSLPVATTIELDYNSGFSFSVDILSHPGFKNTRIYYRIVSQHENSEEPWIPLEMGDEVKYLLPEMNGKWDFFKSSKKMQLQVRVLGFGSKKEQKLNLSFSKNWPWDIIFLTLLAIVLIIFISISNKRRQKDVEHKKIIDNMLSFIDTVPFDKIREQLVKGTLFDYYLWIGAVHESKDKPTSIRIKPYDENGPTTMLFEYQNLEEEKLSIEALLMNAGKEEIFSLGSDNKSDIVKGQMVSGIFWPFDFRDNLKGGIGMYSTQKDKYKASDFRLLKTIGLFFKNTNPSTLFDDDNCAFFISNLYSKENLNDLLHLNNLNNDRKKTPYFEVDRLFGWEPSNTDAVFNLRYGVDQEYRRESNDVLLLELLKGLLNDDNKDYKINIGVLLLFLASIAETQRLGRQLKEPHLGLGSGTVHDSWDNDVLKFLEKVEKSGKTTILRNGPVCQDNSLDELLDKVRLLSKLFRLLMLNKARNKYNLKYLAIFNKDGKNSVFFSSSEKYDASREKVHKNRVELSFGITDKESLERNIKVNTNKLIQNGRLTLTHDLSPVIVLLKIMLNVKNDVFEYEIENDALILKFLLD